MVYGGTGSGLNNSLWKTSYGLTMILSVLRGLGLDSYFGENDIGELFLNLPLPVSLSPYCGLDFKMFIH